MRKTTAREAVKNGRAYVNLCASLIRPIDECHSIRSVGADRIQARKCVWMNDKWELIGEQFSVSPDRIVSIVD